MNMMTAITIILCAAIPAVLSLWAYRQGLRDGQRVSRGEPPERLAGGAKRAPAQTEEEKRLITLMEGVEAYDGRTVE